MIDEVVLGLLALFLPFSLTNNYAIFAEVKEFFGINNNQLGSPFGGNDIDNQPAGSFQNVTFSIRIHNQLDMFLVK